MEINPNLYLNHLLFPEQFKGAYISAEDIGITLEDIKFVKKYSDYVFDNVDPGPYS